YEGFGLPIAESMACGVPCVTARNSSLEEVGGSAAIYVEPMNEKAIAREMEKFENGEYDLIYLKKLSFDQGAKFTWERCARSTVDVYKKCLEIE
ncbi:MAG: glycosyltransferase, partial [Muribaculaceae bacterium]|nr:glycosyltransferase [Muribaculaceae bacterium]